MRIEPVGERCVLIRLGDGVSLETNQLVHAVTALLEAHPLPSVVEVVPAFNSVAVHFNPVAYAAGRGLPTAQLTRQLEQALKRELPALSNEGRLVEIPACYGGEFGPDLEAVAAHAGMSMDDVIALHSGTPLTLYAFFFAPGNPFAGPLDPRLDIGRRKSPRARVEAGSVAIANGLSSIYAATSPGGWNVIARTPWRMFDVNEEPPTRLRLGDRLKFKPVTREEYDRLLEAREWSS
jgi:inhibitor of KinA